ncbi:GNAT family N-acetyltransferase [Amnibacterium kyonggiense]|uniref:L-amino acid N-acyltransferase YncA n=1 Tax=Amnibacterium kyonggiense TaxID=595671 RepID=A0A4R7FMJ7_9MICO|nr:GNAT family N-acetyltransferase [Amnibacterium kyonggiense]TDS77687.1 L-amino acid N-acyltransferase YncA [Amnibacterium kyonggiense]
MPFELRDAGPEDAPALADIHLRARAAAGDAFPPPAHADEELLPHLLQDVLPVAEVRLLLRDGVPVGYATLEGDLLADLYVAPDEQGSGAGTVLLDDAKARRPEGLRLWVFESNCAARGFYERRGFVVVGGTDGDNDEGAPDLLMRWPGADR